MTVNKAFVVVALICFVLATFGVGGVVPLVPLGLSFWVASQLV